MRSGATAGAGRRSARGSSLPLPPPPLLLLAALAALALLAGSVAAAETAAKPPAAAPKPVAVKLPAEEPAAADADVSYREMADKEAEQAAKQARDAQQALEDAEQAAADRLKAAEEAEKAAAAREQAAKQAEREATAAEEAAAAREEKANALSTAGPPPEFTLTEEDGERTVSIVDGGMGFAPCEPGTAVSRISRPIYGNAAAGCNATDTYYIVASACMRQTGCVLRASEGVFGDPQCPKGVTKSLQLSYKCGPTTANRPKPSTVTNARFSSLWGEDGSVWRPTRQLSDWSYAGYEGNDQPIPDYPALKMNGKTVDVTYFGARAGQDSTAAFKAAIKAAEASPDRTKTGVAVVVPAGTFIIDEELSITKSGVVLRGAGAGKTRLAVPTTLAKRHGKSEQWNFGGAFFGIVGAKVDSSRSSNFLARVTANGRRGEYRLKVDNPAALSSFAGKYVRLWFREPGNQKLPNPRRSLLSAGAAPTSIIARALGGARKLLQDAGPAPSPAPAPFPFPNLYSDPYLQAAVEKAAAAETLAADAAYAAGPEPLRADALADDPATQAAKESALNPLGLDPMLLASARYATEGLASELAAGDYPIERLMGDTKANASSTAVDGFQRADAQAVSGSLDFYLYGDSSGVDSGANYKVFPSNDHTRFATRIVRVEAGGWVVLERPLPFDVRTKWAPVLHKFAPTVERSGLEGFSVEFKWAAYPSHFSALGANALALYDVANCWVRDIKVVNADNGINLGGVDFITVEKTRFEFTQPRGTGSSKGSNGHHALWASRCADVLFTDFFLDGKWTHDLSLDQFAEGVVYSNGGGTDVNFDCHRAGTHNNLFSNINVGQGTRVFNSGGEKSRGAYSGANNTWWNIYPSKRAEPIALPGCDYGPLLNFVGHFGKGASAAAARAGRRLLQDSPEEDATGLLALVAVDDSEGQKPQLALAVNGGPIIIPEEEPEAAMEAEALPPGALENDAGSPAAAPDPAPDSDSALAASPAGAPLAAPEPENPFAYDAEEEEQSAPALSAQFPPAEASNFPSPVPVASPLPSPSPSPSPAAPKSPPPAAKSPSPSPNPVATPAPAPAMKAPAPAPAAESTAADAPAPAPAAEAPAPAAAEEEAAGSDDRADALAAGSECARTGWPRARWTVQQFPYVAAKPLVPADLAEAQRKRRLSAARR